MGRSSDSGEASARSFARKLPLRDRIAILGGLAGVTLVSWIYLLLAAARMDGAMEVGAMMRLRPWAAADFALMFGMWAVMMVGMMLPSAAPMALLYAAVARKASNQGEVRGEVLAPTAVFVTGYVVMWTLFSAGATLLQWGLERAALLSPMLVSTSPLLGAVLLVAAGVYQMTPLKDACLKHCRSPAYFISEHWRPGVGGAFRMGSVHGAYCLGCCWLLMGILFFGGVMNLLWIAAITLFVLLEKILPAGRAAGRIAGVALMGLGMAVWIQAR